MIPFLTIFFKTLSTVGTLKIKFNFRRQFGTKRAQGQKQKDGKVQIALLNFPHLFRYYFEVVFLHRVLRFASHSI